MGIMYFLHALQHLSPLALVVQAATASIIPPFITKHITQYKNQHPLTQPATISSDPLPLVIWHGLGDNYEAEGLLSIGDLANATNPGTFVYYVRLGDSASNDRSASFFGNLTTQIAQVCDDLATHPVLAAAPAINALGFSQGGQFMRAYVERCNDPPVANLVTFGSQHNGIREFQVCEDGDWVCQAARGLLRGNTWSGFLQSRLVPAQYFRDPEDLESYLEGSNFLADVNNERGVKNGSYRENMRRLKMFVMYLFEEDKTVVPKESSWWSEVNATTGVETKLRERQIYKEDWLGLRYLDDMKRLEFRSVPGGHMALSDEDLVDAFKRYFGPE